jgi:hypothetical protein
MKKTMRAIETFIDLAESDLETRWDLDKRGTGDYDKGHAAKAQKDFGRALPLVKAAPDLYAAVEDLLSTEECVCEEAELEEGECSVCTYGKLLDRIKAESDKGGAS